MPLREGISKFAFSMLLENQRLLCESTFIFGGMYCRNMAAPAVGHWEQVRALPQMRYRCAYCNTTVGPNVGYWSTHGGALTDLEIYICSFCNRPTFFEGEDQTPAPAFGLPVRDTPKDVMTIYNDARNSMKVSAYTPAVLALRKLLMHVAVEKGAKPNKSFESYVNYLADEGYVPKGGKVWVDRIRDKGNEANHEIRIVKRKDAAEMISFAEMLLKNVYEFPARGARMATSKRGTGKPPAKGVKKG